MRQTSSVLTTAGLLGLVPLLVLGELTAHVRDVPSQVPTGRDPCRSDYAVAVPALDGPDVHLEFLRELTGRGPAGHALTIALVRGRLLHDADTSRRTRA